MLFTFADLILIFLSLGISLAIVVPLTGVLVRFRANFNPKALQLDAEGGAVPHTGPVINSYFSMMARVWRHEGAQGFYKGYMPTLMSTSFVTLLIVIFMGPFNLRRGNYNAPNASLLGTLIYSIGMVFISLPTTIITYRSITTPHKLGFFDLTKALHTILTPTERKKPWILYLTPGLLAAEMLHIGVVILILSPFHRLLLPTIGKPIFSLDLTEISLWKVAVYFVIVTLATAILAPLEVIATRLAIQRNHASSEYNSVSQETEGDGEESVEYSGAVEDVIGLRHEGDPYNGLVDCAKRIVDEEGISALYRAWWITLLGGLISAFG